MDTTRPAYLSRNVELKDGLWDPPIAGRFSIVSPIIKAGNKCSHEVIKRCSLTDDLIAFKTLRVDSDEIATEFKALRL